MQRFGLLLLPLVLLIAGCGGDNACEETLPSIEQYIADNNLTVTEGEEGLRYIILEEGFPERPNINSRVTVNYTGTLTNDVMFDGTPADGSRPVTFTLGNLIRGWQLGIPLVGRGGRVQLFIPAEIGYGPAAVGDICPNSDLIFEIELVRFE